MTLPFGKKITVYEILCSNLIKHALEKACDVIKDKNIKNYCNYFILLAGRELVVWIKI